MNSRNVTDTGGRSWACRQDDKEAPRDGQDVSILCTTPTVHIPLRLTVGWQWMKMSENGLARIITDQSPVPRVAHA
jgi:hypothetical protein